MGFLAVALAPLFLLVFGTGAAGGCKKSAAKPDDEEIEAPVAFDKSEPPPDQRKPVEGADLSDLSDADKNRFETMVDKLPSPCGKAHSLRTSRNTDPSCKRAPFAVTYVLELIKDGAKNADVRTHYQKRYRDLDKAQRKQLKVEGAPRVGPSDAQVKLVEFFDYGCPACINFKPVLEEAAAAFPEDVAVYYKMFPLTDKHVNSGYAAQAALAAWRQGENEAARLKNFKAMHDALFEDIAKHTRADLAEHAKTIGLDKARFDKDYSELESVVAADKQEGINAEVRSTPTLFINGIEYPGPHHPKYLKMFIQETLAVDAR